MMETVEHRCTACNRLLLETTGEVQQVIRIKCRKCGAWNEFKPERPIAVKERECDVS